MQYSKWRRIFKKARKYEDCREQGVFRNLICWRFSRGMDTYCPQRTLLLNEGIIFRETFSEFSSKVLKALTTRYGPVVAFEHGPNREGSATSCGTNHAHIHFVPYHSLTDNLNNTGLEWLMCTASQVDNLVGNNEYLFYCEPGNDWIDPAGRVHILKEPISQFFRKIIAEDQGNVEKYNYKTTQTLRLL